MEINLTIDRGNTAVKAAVWHGDELLDVESERNGSAALLALRLKERYGLFASAIYCSVASVGDDMAALESCARRFIRLDCSTPVPLSVDYATPRTLGVDRIAAAVGARSVVGESRAALVIDVGTAVTYDILTADNHYLGGNIAPGIFMRLKALHDFTAALPAVETDGAIPVWGYDTPTAMRSGAIRGVAAEAAYFRSLAPAGAATVITGGSCNLIVDSGLLDFDFITDNNLVHKGLNSILQYNED